MVFVFGSNCLGRHGKGSAKAALDNHGAIYGQGFGMQGNSFAIPTCSKSTSLPDHEISLADLEFYIICFMTYAALHPELEFQVTQIGCGLAGWKPEIVAPLFINSPDNCFFDSAWSKYLPNRKFWGTF